MDEFEKLEGDLKKLYEVYMEKFRNLTYLEQIVDAYDRQQQVKVEVIICFIFIEETVNAMYSTCINILPYCETRYNRIYICLLKTTSFFVP